MQKIILIGSMLIFASTLAIAQTAEKDASTVRDRFRSCLNQAPTSEKREMATAMCACVAGAFVIMEGTPNPEGQFKRVQGLCNYRNFLDPDGRE